MALYLAAGRLASELWISKRPSAVHKYHVHLRPRFLKWVSKTANWFDTHWATRTSLDEPLNEYVPQGKYVQTDEYLGSTLRTLFPVRSHHRKRGMTAPITIKKHEAVPGTGSYKVRFADGRPSVYFYWDDLPGRRLQSELLTRSEAEARAKELARIERDKLAGAGA